MMKHMVYGFLVEGFYSLCILLECVYLVNISRCSKMFILQKLECSIIIQFYTMHIKL
jgi:hypothetical protein